MYADCDDQDLVTNMIIVILQLARVRTRDGMCMTPGWATTPKFQLNPACSRHVFHAAVPARRLDHELLDRGAVP